MPVEGRVRYRIVERGGKQIRLAFRGKKIVERKEIGRTRLKSKLRSVSDR